jgi:nucleotide-binding universal stress UspA family protein
VLAVRVAEGDGLTDIRPFAKILCAVDASASSRAALRAACDLADRFEAEVVALTVVDDYLMSQASTLSQLDAVALETRFVEIARADLERCVSETVGEAVKGLRRRVEVGRPAESIARVAELEEVSLVACGTHGRSGLARALFGSVAEKCVSRRAPCSRCARDGQPRASRRSGLLAPGLGCLGGNRDRLFALQDRERRRAHPVSAVRQQHQQARRVLAWTAALA